MSTLESPETAFSPDVLAPGSLEQFETVAQRVADGQVEDGPVIWRTDALCRDTSPELFFPVGTTGLAVEQIEAAKNVCRACPAQERCLEFALQTNQDSGVWGASSEEDRRMLRRRYLRRRSA